MDKELWRLYFRADIRGGRRMKKSKYNWGDLIITPVEWVVIGMAIMTILMNL